MKNKIVAGILALLFGLFGVHRFYLGQRFLGIIYFSFAMFGIFMAVEEGAPIIVAPAILGLIDSILLFAMPREDFDDKYNAKRRRRSHRRDWQRYHGQSHRSPAPSLSAYKSSGIKNFRNYYFEEAAEDFEMALDFAPNDPTLHFNLACTYSMLEDAERGFFHLERAVELGFNKLDKIHQHDALALLRALPSFDAFVENGYRRPPASLPAPQANLLDEQPGSDEASATSDILNQIVELGKLRDKGILTEEEFAQQKRKLLEG
ncbi:MAG: NINE protein [Phaeodactylibacter sp.]|nr:NINE protein [Phaeodactylibacter sp.]